MDIFVEFLRDLYNLTRRDIHRTKDRVQKIVQRSLEWTWSIGKYSISVISLVIGAFLFIGWLLVCAIVGYFLWYYLAIPKPMHIAPVYFDFSNPEYGPVAHVNLADQQWSYSDWLLSVSDPQPPEPLLSPDQFYNIDLHLRIPDSPVNQQIGMLSFHSELFSLVREQQQPTCELCDHNTEITRLSSPHVIASSVQSLLPKYKSPPVRWAWTFMWMAPLVTGLRSEDSQYTLTLFDRYHEQSSVPAAMLRVRLGGLQASRAEIYEAKVTFRVQLSGVKYYAYHWFFTSAVFWISIIWATEIFIFLFVALACVIKFRQFLFPSRSSASPSVRNMNAPSPSPSASPRSSPRASPRSSPRASFSSFAVPASRFPSTPEPIFDELHDSDNELKQEQQETEVRRRTGSSRTQSQPVFSDSRRSSTSSNSFPETKVDDDTARPKKSNNTNSKTFPASPSAPSSSNSPPSSSDAPKVYPSISASSSASSQADQKLNKSVQAKQVTTMSIEEEEAAEADDDYIASFTLRQRKGGVQPPESLSTTTSTTTTATTTKTTAESTTISSSSDSNLVKSESDEFIELSAPSSMLMSMLMESNGESNEFEPGVIVSED